MHSKYKFFLGFMSCKQPSANLLVSGKKSFYLPAPGSGDWTLDFSHRYISFCCCCFGTGSYEVVKLPKASLNLQSSQYTVVSKGIETVGMLTASIEKQTFLNSDLVLIIFFIDFVEFLHRWPTFFSLFNLITQPRNCNVM